MHCREAQNTVLQTAQYKPRIFALRPTYLHVHDRRNQLQIIFDPVMHFLEQNVFISQAVFQRGLVPNNGFCHPHE